MLQLELIASFVVSFSLLLVFISSCYVSTKSSSSMSVKLPRSYPLIGSTVAIFANRNRHLQWMAELLLDSPTGTVVLQRAFGACQIITANAANVQHILKTKFSLYPKGDSFRSTNTDFLGSGIFNVDGEDWKFQRQVASHEFNTKALRKFVEGVVEIELNERLIPIFSTAADNNSMLDLQDILQRFAFDNICKIAFGFDPGCLAPSLPQTEVAVAFETATMLSSERMQHLHPIVWKVKRALNIGSERQLKQAISQVRQFAENIIQKKKQQLEEKSSLETADLLSRFLSSGHSDKFVRDMVISFILAGRDTTSAALTWFFWLVSTHSHVEEELLKELREKPEAHAYDAVKDMVYTQASLYESMRLYPSVPVDTKEAAMDDILPDGTLIKKGTRVTYHPYAMGRMENLWGPNCLEFRPERWLARDTVSEKMSFIANDTYTYPVFQAGPRICLGKEMAFLQMKRIVDGVLRRFRIVPVNRGCDPVFISYLTAKMKDGFPVMIEKRADAEVSLT